MGLMDGKVAIVTGAGRGIGRGEALELAREGARVVVNELDAEVGKAVVDEITAAGGEAVLDTGDCSEDDTARGLVATAVDTFGRLDALVNNAGILRDRTVAKMSVDEWDAVIKVHLRGHFLPTHHACALLEGLRAAGPHRLHGLDLRTARQLRPDQLRRGQGRHRGVLDDRRDGDGALRRAVQRDRPRGAHPDDRVRRTATSRISPATTARTTFDFWHPDNVAPLVAYLCSDAAGDISGKVFGVQGDAVELYQPFTSVGGHPEPRHPVHADRHRGPCARAVRRERHRAARSRT